MAIQNILGKIFSSAGAKIVDSIGDAFDKNFTNKEEKLKMQADIEKIVNQHFQEMTRLANDQFKLEVEDRSSARSREAEFLKATGHIDYLMWFLAIAGISLFAYMVYSVMTGHIPEGQKELIFHLFGLVEGTMLVSVYNYYFGSSAGSRIKDMRK